MHRVVGLPRTRASPRFGLDLRGCFPLSYGMHESLDIGAVHRGIRHATELRLDVVSRPVRTCAGRNG
ncbi:MAG TPA: hypothetical protein VGQ90_00625 [Stellaceae bacterium]|jgi:hypothetical protein|nr:hypothetical protein [Stellaceae bacterium]